MKGRRTITTAALLVGLLAPPAAAWTLSVCRLPDAAPYTSTDGQGIDDRVAAILAEAMGARLETVTLPDRRTRTLRRILHAGGCDLAMSVTDKQTGFLTSQVYYATGFVFVVREGTPPPASLDDPALSGLRIGVAGDAQHPAPPVIGLTQRGLADRLTYFPGARLDGPETADLARALTEGQIDVAILWGPAGADLARRHPALRLRLVTPEIDLPVLPMVAMFTVGVRPYDTALRDDVNRALFARWDHIQGVLADAGVPLRPLPRPRAADMERAAP